MKTLIQGAILIALIGMLLNSCEKAELHQTDGSPTVQGSSSSFPWNDASPGDLAQRHNELVAEAIQNQANDPELDTRAALVMIEDEYLDAAAKSDAIDKVAQYSEANLDQMLIDGLQTERAEELYDEVNQALDNNLEYANLSAALDDLLSQIDDQLSGSDWDVLMVYTETVKASAYFWYPTSLGGSGQGSAYRMAQNGGVEDVPGLPGWAKADGRGAGYGMTTWALTGGLGGPIGFLAGTALGAAFSSLDHYAYS